MYIVNGQYENIICAATLTGVGSIEIEDREHERGGGCQSEQREQCEKAETATPERPTTGLGARESTARSFTLLIA